MVSHRLLILIFLFTREEFTGGIELLGPNRDYMLSYGYVTISGESMTLTEKGQDLIMRVLANFELLCRGIVV